MPTNQEKVLAVMRCFGFATSRDVLGLTGLSKRAVSVAIGQLVEQGILRRGAKGSVSLTEKGKSS